jgi:thiol-disulfide isomerase/thioredoxin
VLELFVAHHCPGCPEARQRVREFAEQYQNVTVAERNVDESAAAAEAYGIFATPAIVVNGRSILYNVPTLGQLAARCRAAEAANGVAAPGSQTPVARGRVVIR